MNCKAYLLVLSLLALSGCGHIASKQDTAGDVPPVEAEPLLTHNVPQVNDTLLDDEKKVIDLNAPEGTIAIQSRNIDVLERIRRGFSMPELDSKYVAEYERWDASHPTYLNNLFKRGEPFLFHIVEEIEKRGLPMELALLPAIESAYKPKAVSHSRAAGLWQFIPSTGRGFGLRQDWWYDGRRDLISSTNAALDYLTQLNKMFDGDWFLTLAAYNAGPGTVSRAIKSNKRKRRGTAYTDLKLRSETRRYVPKLLALKNIVNNPAAYNLVLPNVSNQPQFEILTLNGQIDLHKFAESAQIDKKQLLTLNAGFKRWATAPAGPHRLLVPLGSNAKNTDAARLAVQNAPKIAYRNHPIKRGESLSTIARRYGVSVNALKTSNNLRGSSIRAGKNLLIPVRATAQVAANTVEETISVKPASGNKIIHTVKRGDTLWSIARHYKVKIGELLAWNKISSKQILRPNQSLLLFLNQGLGD